MSDEILTLLAQHIDEIDASGPRLPDDELQRVYEAMVTARALDERSTQLHAEGRIGFYVASRGIEAVSVGAGFAAQEGDWVFPSHRDAGLYLLRGGSLRSWLDQLFGNGADLARGRQAPGHHSLPGGRFVSLSGPVGTQLVQAVGCAMAIALRGDRCVALASCGAAAVGNADFGAAMRLAAELRLPAVFVCRSAGAARGADRLLPSVPVADLARAYGVATARVAGADVLAVIQALTAARERALEGAGATLVEAVLENAARPESGGPEVDGSGADPNELLRDYLERKGIWDAAREEDLRLRVRERLDEAVAAASAAAPPAPESLFTDVYAQLPWMLEEQRELLPGGDEEER